MQVQQKQVSIPPHFFIEEAMKEYSNPARTIAIEFIQNSVDAGATSIDITVNANGMKVVDNGNGMDIDTLINGMLTMGGSVKDRPDSVGGFGAAKKILLFSHHSYTIRTRNLMAKGSGLQYDLHTGLEDFKGTSIEIEFYPDGMFQKNYTAIHASIEQIILLSYLPHVSFTLNGKQLSASLIPKAHKTHNGNIEVGFADYVKLSCIFGESITSYVIVRINGLFAFMTMHGEKMTGVMIMDMKGLSRNLLVQNREMLRNQDVLSRILKEYRGNSNIGNSSTNIATRLRYVGMNQFMDLVEEYKDRPGYDGAMGIIAQMLNFDFKTPMKDIVNTFFQILGFRPHNYQRICDLCEIASAKSYHCYIDRAPGTSFQSSESDDYWSRGPHQFTLKHKTLLALMEAAIYDISLNIIRVHYGIRDDFANVEFGFVISSRISAMFRSGDGGKKIFYINPEIADKHRGSRKELVNHIIACALHEFSHIRCGSHDEDYASELTNIVQIYLNNGVGWTGIEKAARSITALYNTK